MTTQPTQPFLPYIGETPPKHTPKTAMPSTKVVCDGPAFSKHPRVFLQTGPRGEVACPYCGHVFVAAASGVHTSHA